MRSFVVTFATGEEVLVEAETAEEAEDLAVESIHEGEIEVVDPAVARVEVDHA